MVEQLIGPNIAGSPVWNIRPKTPKTETGVVPWHQDSSYFDKNTLNMLVVSAWYMRFWRCSSSINGEGQSYSL